MKIFLKNQIKSWDDATISERYDDSYALMRHASLQFSIALEKLIKSKNTTLHIFCGKGNNGGDGLCVAQFFAEKNQNVKVYIIENQGFTKDFESAHEDLKPTNVEILQLHENTDLEEIFAEINKKDFIIDAIFGIGLSRELDDFTEKLILKINQSQAKVVSVDVPSGLLIDEHSTGEIVEATHTFTFQSLKFAYFFQENQRFLGKVKTLDIGLSKDFSTTQLVDNYLITKKIISQIYTPRQKFDHKGTFGASLIIAGSYGKMGAAVLATRACLRTGAGLLTAYIPKIGYDIMQLAVPEAMVLSDNNVWNISDIPLVKPFKAIGVGPGMSTSKESVTAFERLVATYFYPMVVDADALNICSFRKDLLEMLPKNSILTPHLKEFERLFGESQNDFERNELQRQKSKELGLIIVLKGAHSCISTPDGKCYFNSTGNPGMATGGSGDVLTGILTSLLAQGYPSREAAILGVYLHGLAGDLAAKKLSKEALSANDIVDFLGKAFLKIK
jgi:ADP-dependent NAD(P)H-hydrate dehydratase / NAD(P)H-hydrate epimerase